MEPHPSTQGWLKINSTTKKQRTVPILTMNILEHISKACAIVVLCCSLAAFSRIGLDYWTILLLKLAVFPGQQETKTQCKQCSEEHESRTDRHTLDVSWGLRIGEHVGSQERTALPDDVQQDDTSTTAGIGALVI